MVKALLIVFAVRVLGLSPMSPVVGLLCTSIAIGSVAGGVAASVLPRWLSNRRVSLAGLTLAPFAVGAFALSRDAALAVVALAAYELAHTLVIVNGITI